MRTFAWLVMFGRKRKSGQIRRQNFLITNQLCEPRDRNIWSSPNMWIVIAIISMLKHWVHKQQQQMNALRNTHFNTLHILFMVKVRSTHEVYLICVPICLFSFSLCILLKMREVYFDHTIHSFLWLSNSAEYITINKINILYFFNEILFTYVIQSSFHLLQFKTDWQSSYMYICSLFYHFFWLKFEGKLSYCGENNFWCQFPRGSKEICHQILNPTFKYNVTKMLPWFWKHSFFFFFFWVLLFLFPFLACLSILFFSASFSNNNTWTFCT